MPLRHKFAPHVVATVLFLIAFANIARGTSYRSNEYRLWAFEHHAYSDFIAMSTDRYLQDAQPLPYIEDKIEYPVLLGVFGLWLPNRAPGGTFGALLTLGILLLASLLLTISLLQRIEGARVWWIAAFLPLVQYGLLNFDLFAIMLLVLAVYLYAAGRMRDSGLASGAGTWMKLFPVVIVPTAIADLARRKDYRGLGTAAAWFVALSVVVNLPFVILNRPNWSHFFIYNARRNAEGLWAMMGYTDWKALNTLTFLLLLSSVIFACACVYRARPASAADADSLRPFRMGVAFILCAWILTNKAVQPQYILYAAAAGAIAGAPYFLMVPLAVVGVAEYHVAFDCLTPSDRGIGLCRFWATIQVTRAFFVQFVLIWIGMELWRGARFFGAAVDPKPSASAGSR